MLPEDVYNSQAFALLRIEEPKTRKRSARHQAAKVDLPDLLEVMSIAFSKLGPNQKHRVMDIYLQEVEAATFLTDQTAEVRNKVLKVASTFPAVLQKASLWHKAQVPASAWYFLLQDNKDR